MIEELIEEKVASTEYPVIDLIKNRWSPRAFSSESIEQEKNNVDARSCTLGPILL
jgi:hypothetical protein